MPTQYDNSLNKKKLCAHACMITDLCGVCCRHSEEADEDHLRDSRKKDKLKKDSKAAASSSRQINKVCFEVYEPTCTYW